MALKRKLTSESGARKRSTYDSKYLFIGQRVTIGRGVRMESRETATIFKSTRIMMIKAVGAWGQASYYVPS